MQQQITIKRGLILAFLWGAVGASLPYLAVLGYYYVRFRIQEHNLGEFNYYMTWYQQHITFSTFRFATIFYFSGLTTYITAKYHGFAKTIIRQIAFTFLLHFFCCLFYPVPQIMTEYDNTPDIAYDNYLWFLFLNALVSATLILMRLRKWIQQKAAHSLTSNAVC